MMDDEEIAPGREIEVIDLSQGEAHYTDVFRDFEESVACTRDFDYPQETRLTWSAKTGPGQVSILQDFSGARNRYYRPWSAPSQTPDEAMYRFYNVTWVEREGSVAHRRAVGRIRKESWERCCSEPVRIVLG